MDEPIRADDSAEREANYTTFTLDLEPFVSVFWLLFGRLKSRLNRPSQRRVFLFQTKIILVLRPRFFIRDPVRLGREHDLGERADQTVGRSVMPAGHPRTTIDVVVRVTRGVADRAADRALQADVVVEALAAHVTRPFTAERVT